MPPLVAPPKVREVVDDALDRQFDEAVGCLSSRIS